MTNIIVKIINGIYCNELTTKYLWSLKLLTTSFWINNNKIFVVRKNFFVVHDGLHSG